MVSSSNPVELRSPDNLYLKSATIMKKLDKALIIERRAFLRKVIKRSVAPVVVIHSLRKAKADPLYGESRQNEVL